MSPIVAAIISGVVCLGAGFLFGIIYRKKVGEAEIGSAEEQAKKKEAKLDKKITSKHYPRKLIYQMAKFKEDTFIFAKRTLKKVSPKLFIFLKNKTMIIRKQPIGITIFYDRHTMMCR